MALTITNGDRVVFPATGHTKAQVVDYYRRAAPRLLPHVAGRPLTLHRFPRGMAAPGFFQKNVPPHYPASMERCMVARREGQQTTYPVVSVPEHLAFLANQGVLELHAPTSTARDLFHPDRFLIDLDPPAGAVEAVRRAARRVRSFLEELEVASIPMATGSKGYHVVAVLAPTADSEAVSRCGQQLATLLAHAEPGLLTDVFRIAGRGQRVFVDWLRNQPMATGVAPWSLRARAGASVACPLRWDDLDRIAPDGYDLDGAPLDGPDPLAELSAHPVDGARLVAAVEERFARSGLDLPVFDRFRS